MKQHMQATSVGTPSNTEELSVDYASRSPASSSDLRRLGKRRTLRPSEAKVGQSYDHLLRQMLKKLRKKHVRRPDCSKAQMYLNV